MTDQLEPNTEHNRAHATAAGPTDRATDRLSHDHAVTAGQRIAGPESRHETSAQSASSPPSASPATDITTVDLRTNAPGDHRTRRGVGRPGLADTLARLSSRDVALIDLLAEHRFLTTHHVQGFCFHDHATLASAARSTRRVLSRLERERLIARPARRVGGIYGGSDAHVWALTSVGHRLRSLRVGTGTASRGRTPSARFIEHYLAIADVRLDLVDAERAGALLVSRVQIEPVCWQPYTGLGGSREVLKPDLAAITTPAHDRDFEDSWYLEVDRGTESIPTLLRQCRAYEACRDAGLVQAERGVFPIVVWIVPTERRAANLRTAIDHARSLDSNLYRVCTYDQLRDLILGGAA